MRVIIFKAIKKNTPLSKTSEPKFKQLGKEIEVNAEQKKNAKLSILVHSGKEILVKLVQLTKAESPIKFTFGKEINVNEVQP